jgi:hypothetical protein
MTDVARLVRYEPALALSGLFRPLQARQHRPGLSVTQEFNGLTYEWVAPAAPGVPEQTLLMALVALAAPGCQRLASQAQTPIGRQLRNALAGSGELFEGETASVRTSLSELARMCGYADCGGTNLDQMRQMLRRLAEITVWARTPDYEASSRLLSVVISGAGDTRVALNTRLARAAWGEGQYVKVSMAERLTLTSQTGMALHAYLSGVIKPGKSHSFQWSRLELAVWGNATTGSTFRSRKAKLAAALANIAETGWTINAEGSVAHIDRHSDNKTTAKRQQVKVKNL